jgi:hypothetical protein
MLRTPTDLVGGLVHQPAAACPFPPTVDAGPRSV